MTERQLLDDISNAFREALAGLNRKWDMVRLLYRARQQGNYTRQQFIENVGAIMATAAFEVSDTLRLLGENLQRNARSGEALKHIIDEPAREPGAEG